MSGKSKSMFYIVIVFIVLLIAGGWWMITQTGSGNVEQVQSELRVIAAGAQDYYLKPRMIGGGGKSFEGITFDEIRLQGAERSSDSFKISTKSADYAIDEVEPERIVVSAAFTGGGNNGLRAEIGPDSLLIREF